MLYRLRRKPISNPRLHRPGWLARLNSNVSIVSTQLPLPSIRHKSCAGPKQQQPQHGAVNSCALISGQTLTFAELSKGFQ